MSECSPDLGRDRSRKECHDGARGPLEEGGLARGQLRAGAPEDQVAHQVGLYEPRLLRRKRHPGDRERSSAVGIDLQRVTVDAANPAHRLNVERRVHARGPGEANGAAGHLKATPHHRIRAA